MDIAVVGAGIAAAAAVRTIGQAASVIVVAPREGGGDRIGESLSPSARPLLQDLGLLDLFEAEGHAPCRSTFSAWGHPHLAQRHNAAHPGWAIDRPRFERFLWLHTSEYERRYDRVRRIQGHAGAWTLELASGGCINARFVLDCSGRACVVGSRLATRQRESQLVATHALLEHTDPGIAPTRAVLVETCPEGWWYSSYTPANKLVVAFFTDAERVPKRKDRDEAGWESMLRSAPYTWQRIETGGFAVGGVPTTVDAGTLLLDPVFGQGWAAAGDAAAALDPLLAHGMTVALWSGREAALAAVAALSGDDEDLRQYGDRFERGVARYRTELDQQYASERRFSGAPFWARRVPDL
jgi:flavin-dependent dehydrogenase